ncbi:hypothetical protein HY68_03905 [Streptomyces sp. AcH 505]|uniref:SH3 domain-containing protein n=1 Tax=unclassified Streptomyces TaxID=2593676 RepID=UPI00059239A0|nr:SH3 domain-containing protein [Streptomyces sp. NBC_00370]KIF67987.1 hypothetical protein HY68_03905 [Streptomyces sp. AcH 505]
MPLRSLGLSAAAIAAIAAATLTTAPAALAAPPAPSTASDSPAAVDTPSATSNRPVAREDSPATEHSSRSYLGKVTARTGLLLRDKPTRSSRVVRSEPYGALVHIFCRTRGGNVNGNTSWYLLTDGTWAWGSAAYIANIGAVPRWC